MSDTVWTDLSVWQMLGIAVCFIWSGFVRSGLGFGGAALALPLLLIINNDPLFYLPAICWQLLFFSLLNMSSRWKNVDWKYLGHLSLILVVPFAAGLFGLLNLSPSVLSTFVYTMTLAYGVLYVLDKVLTSGNRIMDIICIVGGGYASGVSLVGAPLIIAYSTRRLPAEKLRDTLFVAWILLVVCKISTFVVAEVNLQIQLTMLTFPMAAIGHWLGLKAHGRMLAGDPKRFRQIIGAGLVLVSILGLWSVL